MECAQPYAIPAKDVAAWLESEDLTANVEFVSIDTYAPAVSPYQPGFMGMAAQVGQEDAFRKSLDVTFDYAKTINCKTINILSGLVFEADSNPYASSTASSASSSPSASASSSSPSAAAASSASSSSYSSISQSSFSRQSSDEETKAEFVRSRYGRGFGSCSGTYSHLTALAGWFPLLTMQRS